MTATALILAALSPLLVALIRQRPWPREIVVFMSLLAVTACYVIGRAFDQALTWPLTSDFWIGLAAAYGSQQLFYQGLRAAAPGALAKIESTWST